MFIRRQDAIDRFADNFREAADGGMLFQPPRAQVAVPLASEEYEAVMAAFERTHVVNMVITWAAILAAMAYGFHHLIVDGRFLHFFVALGLAFLFSFALTLRDGLGLLLPFVRRRDELLRAMATEAPAVPGATGASPNSSGEQAGDADGKA